MKTFYWYDFETFGLSPKTSRIAQFAGIRTDENLNILDEKMFYCKPTNDCLPSPQACAVTGITPQLCQEKGLIEHAFIKKIHTEFSAPNTCVVGYNSIRFDDEFTRYTLYRNFIDPYTWHWKNGNTRWDILDVVRLCYALKKNSSLNWVYDETGKPIFKLDQLSLANGIEHADAHDALADVRATIALGKKIKETQPQLFEYAFSLREKKTVNNKIKLFKPMLHTSGMYPAQQSCTRLCVALAYHPQYNDRAIVFNLDQDPTILLELELDALKKRLFSKQSELPKNVERLQIKELIFNKSPMFVPNVHKLEPKIVEQLQLDMDKCGQHLQWLTDKQAKVHEVVQNIYRSDFEKIPEADVDQALYDGFIDNADRHICNQIQTLSVDALKDFHPKFKDPKLSKLLLHFKGRNYPQSLNANEAENWFEIVQSRIQSGENNHINLDDYFQTIAQMRSQYPNQKTLWQQLESYGESLL